MKKTGERLQIGGENEKYRLDTGMIPGILAMSVLTKPLSIRIYRKSTDVTDIIKKES